MHHPRRISCILFLGWGELAATNAPVVDEPVEAVFRMNEKPILPARIIFFFHLFSTPKFSPILPTTYQPLPPSPIARAPETLSRSELGEGSLEQELGARELAAGAWKGALSSRAVEAGAVPT